MIKYASNALLATLISFSNEIANLGAAIGGIDTVDVSRGVHAAATSRCRRTPRGRASRRSPPSCEAGCGFGGSCLPKDVAALAARGAAPGRRRWRCSRRCCAINAAQPGEVLRLRREALPGPRGHARRGARASRSGPTPTTCASRRRSRSCAALRGARRATSRPTTRSRREAARARFGDDLRAARLARARRSRDCDVAVLVTRWTEFEAIPELIVAARSAAALRRRPAHAAAGPLRALRGHRSVTPLGLDDLRTRIALPDPGAAMHELMRELYPLCRSITGDGVRETLKILGRWLPLGSTRGAARERPFSTGSYRASGTCARPGSRGRAGETVVDFRDSNLHVVGYSVPIRARLSLAELRPAPARDPGASRLDPVPDFVLPRDVGLLSRRSASSMRCTDGAYEVVHRRDARRTAASATARRCCPASRTEEILLCAHVCHPSLCNDNLSGLALLALLGRYLAGSAATLVTYRFLFAPVTIGAITWLARNESAARAHPPRARRDAGRRRRAAHLQAEPARRTRRSTAPSRTCSRHARPARDSRLLAATATTSGSSARPGFDLPVGCLMRTPHGRVPRVPQLRRRPRLREASPRSRTPSTALSRRSDVLEGDRRYRNLSPKGRAAARPARPLPGPGRPGRRRRPRDGPVVGAESVRWDTTVCWTSPSDRDSDSTTIHEAASAAGRARTCSAGSQKVSCMKVVLFCGGLGMRLRDQAENVPKPMVTHRLSADPLAPDEVLRPLRAQGLHPVPRLQGRR